MSDGLYRFSDLELNWNTRELFRNGSLVAVEPKALELLHYLLRHRDRAVGKDELAKVIWRKRVISDTVISQTVHKARIALTDDSDRQTVIATVRGFGYRFVAPVAETPTPALPDKWPTAESGTSAEPFQRLESPARKIPLVAFLGIVLLLVGTVAVMLRLITPDLEISLVRTSESAESPLLVAILPFSDEHSSASDRALAQSLNEALNLRIAETSGIQIRSPRVVGLLMQDQTSLPALMNEAKVDFLLSGSLQPSLARDRRELDLELVGERDGMIRSLPLGRFSVPFPESAETFADFMKVRDTIIERLTRTLIPALEAYPASRDIGPRSPDAFRLLLAAIREVRAVQCDDQEAEVLLRRAVELDPEFHYARMAMAWIDYAQYRNCGHKPLHLSQAEAHIELVLNANPNHPVALLINTLVQVENGNIEDACEQLEAALHHHRSIPPQLRLSLAHALTYAGFLDQATHELDALVGTDPIFLSFEKPFLPMAYLYSGRAKDFVAVAPSLDVPSFIYYQALAELMLGDEPAARSLLEPASQRNPIDLGSRMSEALLAILDHRPEIAIAIVMDIDSDASEERKLNGETLFQLGRLLYQAGSDEQALDRFERAVAAGFFCLACLENDTLLAGLSEHPRWLQILDSAQERRLAMVERLGPAPLLTSRLDGHPLLASGQP